MDQEQELDTWPKHAAFRMYTGSPINGGPPLDVLRATFITPTEHFFARNHGATPEVERNSYRLSVDGLIKRPLSLSLDELQHRFAEHTVTVTLECAGNRRDELLALAPIPGELPWGAEGISTAVWTGLRLCDLLDYVGIKPDAAHVAFLGLDATTQDSSGFGGSIPLAQALDPTTLLAYAMNGEPLQPLHGFPLRVIVPGYIGARSVKWLKHIAVQHCPSTNYFQAHAYQLFPPDVCAETVDWTAGQQLGELMVNAVICSPADGAIVTTPQVVIQGYAIAGGDRTVQLVEVSSDGGRSWIPATLEGEACPGVWQFWEAAVELVCGPATLLARAADSTGLWQPADKAEVWNFKGYMNNAWHRIEVQRVDAAVRSTSEHMLVERL